jgi:hypothetical protein
VAAAQVLGQQAGGRIAAHRHQRALQTGRVREQLDLNRPPVVHRVSPGASGSGGGARSATVARVAPRRAGPRSHDAVCAWQRQDDPGSTGQRPGHQPPADVRHLHTDGLAGRQIGRVQQLGADGRELVDEAEQIVDPAAEHPSQPQRHGHRRGGLAGLDGADRLAGHAGAVSELSLGDAELRPRRPQQHVKRAVVRHVTPPEPATASLHTVKSVRQT